MTSVPPAQPPAAPETEQEGTCPECLHQWSPDGCTGDPTPSDLWAGVSPSVCDCPCPIPAAPETDVRLTEAECAAMAEALGIMVRPNGYLAVAVERIVAERVRVVEGERDAAREAVAWWVDNWADLRTVLTLVADRVDDFTYDEFSSVLDDSPCDHEGEPYTNARAESDEAAHRALQAAVEALAEKWEGRESHTPGASEHAAALRALLAGGEER